MKKAFNFFRTLTVILVLAVFTAISASAQSTLIIDENFDNMTALESKDLFLLSDVNKVYQLVNTPGGTGKSIKVFRDGSVSATACLDFNITAAKPTTYIIEASFRLDAEKTMGTTVNRVIGVRKVFASGTQIESFVFASKENGLFLSDNASGSKVTQKLADLSATKFTKVSVAVNETTGKYSVYVDGVKAAENLPFVNSSAVGTGYTYAQARIAFFSAAAVENVYYVDDIKVYSGTEPSAPAQTTTAATTTTTTTTTPGSTSPSTGSTTFIIFAGLSILSAAAFTVCRKRDF